MLWRDKVLMAEGDGAGAPAAPSGGTAVSGETSTPGVESPGAAFEGLGGGLDDDLDMIEVSAGQSQTPSATPAGGVAASPSPATSSPGAQAAPPEPAPAATPPASTPAPAQAAPQTPPAAAPQGEAPQAAPTSIPSDPAGLLQEMEKNREGIIDALATDSSRFGLSADEVTLLETDPAKAVPRLLARTYYTAMNATLAHINNLVPGMIARHMKMTELQTEREKKFYGQFPALDKAKHSSDVATFANLFRQQNPNLSEADFFAMLGAAVMAKHGLTMNGVPAAAPQPGVKGPPPQPAVTAPPFSPAAPGGATVRVTPVEENPFEGLGRDFDE